VVAATLQLIAHRGLAGAGKPLDQVVPPAHARDDTQAKESASGVRAELCPPT
jgi:hypothetical protein